MHKTNVMVHLFLVTAAATAAAAATSTTTGDLSIIFFTSHWSTVELSDDDHRTDAPHAYVVLLFRVYSGQLCLVFCLVFLVIWVVAKSEAQIISCNTSVSLCNFLVSIFLVSLI
jgi:hypothetical protein